MPSHDRASGLHALESGSVGGALQPDFLSQILTLVRLRAELIVSAEYAAPWAVNFGPGPAYFHVLSEGGMRVEAGGGRVVEAAAGDLLVLPQGLGHTPSTPGGRVVELRELLATRMSRENLTIRTDGPGPVTRMITGAFRFEGDNLPEMLAVLPAIIHIPRSLRGDDGWIDAGAQFVLGEAVADRPGAWIVISRMIDVLVIRMMRIWVQTASPEDKGWLGALADARISRALKAIHDEPFRRRTVAELAAVAGMSRSSFAERFATLIGAAPLHYQTRWRLLLASEMLKRADTRVSDIARRVGYDSDAAFSRAFKAQFGFAPSLAKQPGA